MKKTIFAVMLACVLTFMLCALPAFADETEPADGLFVAAAPTTEAVDTTEGEDVLLDVAAPVSDAIDTAEEAAESIDAAAESIDLEAAMESVDADDLMENGVNDITAAAEEDTDWLGGTSGIIAIIVAVVILVAAIIAICVLAPKKSKQK